MWHVSFQTLEFRKNTSARIGFEKSQRWILIRHTRPINGRHVVGINMDEPPWTMEDDPMIL